MVHAQAPVPVDPIRRRTTPRRALLMLTLSLSALLLTGPQPTRAETAAPAAKVVEVGAALPRLVLTDQHGEQGRVDAATRILLFASDRASGKIAHAALEPIGANGLAAAGALFVADISPMPGFISSTLAVPKMRKYSYQVLLGQEPADTAALPRRPDQVTLLRATDGTITGVEFIGSAEALSRALAQD